MSTRFDGQAAVFTGAQRQPVSLAGGRNEPSPGPHPEHPLIPVRGGSTRPRARAPARRTARRGHLRAAVQARTVTGDARTLVFEVQPGPILQADVTFPGARCAYDVAVAGRRGRRRPRVADPEAALRGILAAYQAAFYLARGGGARVQGDARVSSRCRFAKGRARAFSRSVRRLHAGDADLIAQRGSRPAPSTTPRGPSPRWTMRGHYFGLGYSSVRVNPRLDPRGTDVDLVFEVTEGERVTVAAVVLRGLRHARESLVRTQVQLTPGDPLDPRKVAELERRLLDLGLFTRAAATVSTTTRPRCGHARRG